MPNDAHLVIRRQPPDGVELGRVEIARNSSGRTVQRDGLHDHGQGRAILRSGLIQELRRAPSACTGHVFNDDGGVARNVVAEEISGEAAIQIVSPAGAEPDIDRHRLAFVEIRGVVLRKRAGAGKRHDGPGSGELGKAAAPELGQTLGKHQSLSH